MASVRGLMLDTLGLEKSPENMGNTSLAILAGVGVATFEAAGGLRNWASGNIESVKMSKSSLKEPILL